MAMVVVTIVKLTIITMVTIITIVLMTIVSASKFLGFVSLPIWIAAEAEFQKKRFHPSRRQIGDLGFLRKQLKSFSTIWGQNKIKINIHRIGFSHTDSIQVKKVFILATVKWWWRISFNWRARHMGQKYIIKWKWWKHANLTVECVFQLYGGTSINKLLNMKYWL